MSTHAGADGALLHCGTDQDDRCRLFSSFNLTLLTLRPPRLEQDEGLSSIVDGRLYESAHVRIVDVPAEPRNTSTSVPLCHYASNVVPFLE